MQVLDIVNFCDGSIKFVDVLRQLNSTGMIGCTENELKEMVEMLCGEEEFIVRGKTNGEKVIMKR